MSKIVCIGWSKTGTGSVGQALRVLCGGASVTQRPFKGNGTADLQPLDFGFIPQAVIPLLRKYRCFHDFPWAYWFPLIDKLYPGSKFIYTYREDTETWIRSCKAYYKPPGNPTSEMLYNGHRLPDSPQAETIWIRRYMQHHDFIDAYFSASGSNLLRINIDRGELAWDRLCGFLGVPVPDCEMPWINRKQRV